LAVVGPDNIGKETIITKAVIFFFKRHPSISNSNVYRVELGEISDYSEVIVRIAEAFTLSSP
jgi:hypothetical protein